MLLTTCRASMCVALVWRAHRQDAHAAHGTRDRLAPPPAAHLHSTGGSTALPTHCFSSRSPFPLAP